MITAYVVTAVIVMAIGLATTPRPRSILLMAVAALLWPLTMAAVAAHALRVCLRARQGRVGQGGQRQQP